MTASEITPAGSYRRLFLYTHNLQPLRATPGNSKFLEGEIVSAAQRHQKSQNDHNVSFVPIGRKPHLGLSAVRCWSFRDAGWPNGTLPTTESSKPSRAATLGG